MYRDAHSVSWVGENNKIRLWPVFSNDFSSRITRASHQLATWKNNEMLIKLMCLWHGYPLAMKWCHLDNIQYLTNFRLSTNRVSLVNSPCWLNCRAWRSDAGFAASCETYAYLPSFAWPFSGSKIDVSTQKATVNNRCLHLIFIPLPQLAVQTDHGSQWCQLIPAGSQAWIKRMNFVTWSQSLTIT